MVSTAEAARRNMLSGLEGLLEIVSTMFEQVKGKCTLLAR